MHNATMISTKSDRSSNFKVLQMKEQSDITVEEQHPCIRVRSYTLKENQEEKTKHSSVIFCFLHDMSQKKQKKQKDDQKLYYFLVGTLPNQLIIRT